MVNVGRMEWGSGEVEWSLLEKILQTPQVQVEQSLP